jgi:sporulation protein YlmC with PRC-barrel domain
MPKSTGRCYGLNIKGSLSEFFPANIDITEKLARSIMGLPIKDMDGKMIGKITGVNFETKEWTGRIIVDCNIYDHILVEHKQSMEIVKEKKQ